MELHVTGILWTSEISNIEFSRLHRFEKAVENLDAAYWVTSAGRVILESWFGSSVSNGNIIHLVKVLRTGNFEFLLALELHFPKFIFVDLDRCVVFEKIVAVTSNDLNEGDCERNPWAAVFIELTTCLSVE